MADGNFSAEKFRAELAKRGVVRPTRFEVRMGLPPALSGTYQLNQTDLVGQARDGTISLWCETASLPGVALDYYPVRRYGYGPVENKPFAPKFTDANMTFRSDGNGLVHTFLHAWMRVALNYDFGGAINQTTGAVPGQHPFELSYKEDYMQDVHVLQFDDAGNKVLEVVLREAYPVYVGDVPLSWGSIDEYSRIPATFTFIGWYNVGQESPISANQPAGDLIGP